MAITLTTGDPVPRFVAPSRNNPQFHLDAVAGRYLVLTFFGSAAQPGAQEMLAKIAADVGIFNNRRAAFLGITIDPADFGERAETLPQTANITLLLDANGQISHLYGLMGEPNENGQRIYAPASIIVDPGLRFLTHVPIADFSKHADILSAIMRQLPELTAQQRPAPILVLPRVFEPEFCAELIRYYAAKGGQDSGFMREQDGRTVPVLDHSFKRRTDCVIEDETLLTQARKRIELRLVPEIARSFQFQATRIERYIVARYGAAEGGYFRAHRDNTTKGTAHRRFAVTINLNAADYDGGDLCFPEFGQQTYRAPTGGAVVFSCSVLHEATPVTRGERYCFLPFLYDEQAAAIRDQNRGFLGPTPKAPDAALAPESQSAAGEKPEDKDAVVPISGAAPLVS